MGIKTCNRCKKEVDLAQFRKRMRGAKSHPQPYCLPCQREYDREYWQRTRARRNKLKRISDRKLRQRNGQFIVNYLKNHNCVDCGESDPVVLEFDHRGNKFDNISNLIGKRIALEKIFSEIKKCEIRCANCHRRKTAKDLKWHSYIK